MASVISTQPYTTPTTSCFSFCADAEVGAQQPVVRRPNLSEDRWTEAEDRKRKEEVDSLLSEAMSRLTFKERQENQEILHGVAETVTEDKQVLERALHDLDYLLLSCTKLIEGSAYEKAELMDPEYVSARSFRAMFLRANDYDSKKSADQMLRFFEHKLDLFGPDKLVKDITIDDLDDNDMACLKAGGLQLLGEDRSGRQQLFYVCGVFGEYSKYLKNDMRIQFFMVMKNLESEEAQLRGNISIWYATGECRSKSKERKRWSEFFASARALPQKKASVHLCIGKMQPNYRFSATAFRLMKASMRVRCLLHCGSSIECHYQLATFGIPSKLLPIDDSGRLMVDRHLEWVQSCCKTKDSAFDRSISLKVPKKAGDSSVTPCPCDVIFTGGKANYMEGNKRFLALVQDHLQRSDSSATCQKQQIVDGIIGSIHESGGRFLRRQAGSNSFWEEIPLADLRKKVIESFRNRRRRKNRRRQDASK